MTVPSVSNSGLAGVPTPGNGLFVDCHGPTTVPAATGGATETGRGSNSRAPKLCRAG
jgi:hypothetical protein